MSDMSLDFSDKMLWQDFEDVLPLCFCRIYYVESPGNDTLNSLVRQFFHQNPNGMLPCDLKHLTYSFCYYTQEDVCPDNLHRHFGEADVNAYGFAADEAVSFLRECLYAETGGYLVARRLLPEIQKDVEEVWGAHEMLLSLSLLNETDIESAIGWFVLQVAQEDFHSLSGIEYSNYYHDKYCWREQRSTPGMLGMIIRRLNTPEIDAEMEDRAILVEQKIREWIPDDGKDALKVFERALEIRKNRAKINEFCKIEVGFLGDIKYVLPNNQKRDVKFIRGTLGRTLYILFLRQIERAAADRTGQTSPCICVSLLYKYREELLAIYEKMTPRLREANLSDTIEKLWRSPSNVISKNNDFFRENFNLESIDPKYYTIEVVGKNEKGEDLYAVGLDVEDFDLGWFSIFKLKV